jgi:predicted Zn-dependent protease
MRRLGLENGCFLLKNLNTIMSSKSRRQLLEEMLVSEPTDPFLRYGLALEFAREGQTTDAITRLRDLARDKPDYVPAYFQAAQLLIQLGESAEAAQLLRSGIAAARTQSNLHAVEEMSALLAQLE